MKLNRKIPPAIREVTQLHLPRPRLLTLDNGLPLYALDFPGCEVVKVEAVFLAGRPEEEKQLVSRAVSRLLRDGTSTKNGADIAEYFDFYGASFGAPTNLDMANFTLFSLRKYAADVIPLYAELLQDPIFPEHELDTFKRTSIQELLVDLEKVEVPAYRKLTELIFGENHPYGYNSTPESYNALLRDDLFAHYHKWYTHSNCKLFVTGHIDDALLTLLNRHLGQWQKTGPVAASVLPLCTAQPARLDIPHPGSLQTAVKIGRHAFNRDHPDFTGLFVLNTILGGYFGSRLMMNIREKKGYTYNIYSTLDAMLYDGCLYIATEVSPGKAKATEQLIFKEMQQLRDEPVPEEELAMVRNYLLGMLLNGLDGPMNIAELVRNQIVEKLPWEQFETMVETIRTITPAQLQTLAQRYLQPEDFWVVTVGGEKAKRRSKSVPSNPT